jgi:hypothetical protein
MAGSASAGPRSPTRMSRAAASRANDSVTALRRPPDNGAASLSRNTAPPNPSQTSRPHVSGMRSFGNSQTIAK